MVGESGLVELRLIEFIYFICMLCFFFFFNDTATTEIYTLSLHDALPISRRSRRRYSRTSRGGPRRGGRSTRSEEHTSELQSQSNLVCRLLLEKKTPLCRHGAQHPRPDRADPRRAPRPRRRGPGQCARTPH